jgi:predicted permease
MLATLIKTFTATILMWMAGQCVLHLCRELPDGTGFDVLRLAVVVPTAVAVYTLAAKLLHIEMLSLFSGKKS